LARITPINSTSLAGFWKKATAPDWRLRLSLTSAFTRRSGEAADSIWQELTACRVAGEAAMRRRFERAKSEGDLPANVNPADLARYIATVLYGMAVEAAGGASRSKLQRVVEMALRMLPM
jgi:hypothetical protein